MINAAAGVGFATFATTATDPAESNIGRRGIVDHGASANDAPCHKLRLHSLGVDQIKRAFDGGGRP